MNKVLLCLFIWTLSVNNAVSQFVAEKYPLIEYDELIVQSDTVDYKQWDKIQAETFASCSCKPSTSAPTPLPGVKVSVAEVSD